MQSRERPVSLVPEGRHELAFFSRPFSEKPGPAIAP